MTHLDHLLKVIPDLPDRKILDLGAGRGAFLIDAIKRGFAAEGVEYNPNYIQIAFENAKKEGLILSLKEGAGESLPYSDRSFDFINVAEIIEHVQDPVRVVSEIARVLALGGVAYISVPNRYGFYDPHFHIYGVNWLPRSLSENFIKLFKKQKDYSDRDAGHQKLTDMHYMTRSQFEKLCNSYGLVYKDSREKKLTNLPFGTFLIPFYKIFSFFFIPTFHGLVYNKN